MQKIALIIVSALVCSGALAGDPIRPNPKLTPGVINPAVKDVCKTKWGKDARHVTTLMKKLVFAWYRIPYEKHSEYEVDHLISRELAGADDARNLWPQTWAHPYGAHEKDRLENRLHVLVCQKQLSLGQAQTAIRKDWIKAYHTYCK